MRDLSVYVGYVIGLATMWYMWIRANKRNFGKWFYGANDFVKDMRDAFNKGWDASCEAFKRLPKEP